MKTLIKWLASFYDESSPNSFSRLITTVIVAFVLGWDTAYMRHEHKLVDSVTLLAQGGFMTLFYAARRIAGAYTDTKLGAQQETDSGKGIAGTGQ
jgi:hypothetical protein